MDNRTSDRAPVIVAWITLAALTLSWLVWAYIAAIISLLMYYGIDSSATSAKEKAAAIALVSATASQLVAIVVSAAALVARHKARTWPAYGRWLGVTTAGAVLPAVVLWCAGSVLLA